MAKNLSPNTIQLLKSLKDVKQGDDAFFENAVSEAIGFTRGD
jgi:hypothetical protein